MTHAGDVSAEMVGQFSYVALLTPVSIGSMTLRNRIVMPALLTGCASQEGEVTQQLKDFCEERAAGGVGLIITEGSDVHPAGRAYANGLSISDDHFVPGLGELARVIQRQGAKAGFQLQHFGRRASSQVSGMQPVAPSELQNGVGETTHALTVTEIHEVVRFFALGARRAKEAGFDGVEIGMTAEALIGNFLSRAYNRRQDAYGGDLGNRCRLMVQVIRAVRDIVGPDYPVWCRLDGKQDEAIGDGITLEEAKDIAQIAEKAGAQAIHVYCGSSGAPISAAERPLSGPHLVSLAEAIKAVVAVPVITAGAITPEDGEEIIRAQKADLVAIGKGLVADPDLPKKIASGLRDEIRPCIKCLNCVNTVIHESLPIRCSVNAQAGREGECLLNPTKIQKTVLIVGAGPAGMEAARVAALRGHRVILCDRAGFQGGHLCAASVPPDAGSIALFSQYLQTSLQRLNIQVRLGTRVTREMIQDLRPDAVIIATGAEPVIPNIPGINNQNVVNAIDVLSGRQVVGRNVLVVGGGLVGCETAEFLAGKGAQVTILEMLPRIANDAFVSQRLPLLARMEKIGIDAEVGIKVLTVTPRGVTASRNGEPLSFEADTVVISVGLKSNRTLASSLEGMAVETYVIGDCLQPRRIVDAIREGFHAGRTV